MADKKPFVNYSGELKEIAASDTIAVANGGVDQLAWTAYTPTLANISLGNGTLACSYKYLTKKTIAFNFQLTVGSTTTFSSGVIHTFTLPVLAISSKAIHSYLGKLIIYDASSNIYYAGSIMLETNSGTITASLFTEYANIAYTYLGALQAGVPITFASGDILSSTILYETA